LKYLIVLLLLTSYQSWGQSNSLNLAIPNSSQSYQSDKFRAGQLDCQMAIGASTNVEFGVVGLLSKEDGNSPHNQEATSFNSYNTPNMRDIGVYAKITIPIGAPKERLNCNTLYQLELTKKRLEVQKLTQEVENLKRLAFEN